MQGHSTFQETRQSGLRALRKTLDTGLPLVGVAFIIGAVLFMQELFAQIAVVTVGILLLEAGIWKLAHQLLPGERTYLALRLEVDQFIALVRGLNEAALQVRAHNAPASQQAFEEIQAAMHQAVERMAQVAGKTEAELAYRAKRAATKEAVHTSQEASALPVPDLTCCNATQSLVANDE